MKTLESGCVYRTITTARHHTDFMSRRSVFEAPPGVIAGVVARRRGTVLRATPGRHRRWRPFAAAVLCWLAGLGASVPAGAQMGAPLGAQLGGTAAGHSSSQNGGYNGSHGGGQGGGQLPALGDGSEFTLAAERQLGDRIAREIYRDADFVDDALLSEYLQAVWHPLVAAARARGELSADMEARFAWTTMLIRDRSVNAFALPGGYMGVHLGLMAIVSSPDELASVLAHELTHVTQRHIARMDAQQSRQTPWVIAAMVLGALAASKSPGMAGALMTGGQAAAIQGQLNFSRDMEREADRIGFNVMTQAGYDPPGFVAMFEKLQQAARLNDSGAYPYLRSHPLTTERIADMQGRVESGAGAGSGMPRWRVTSELAHALLAARARVLADGRPDVLRQWIGEAQAERLQAQPLARQANLRYAAALAHARLRETDAARRELATLAVMVGRDAEAQRVLRLTAAELALQAGQPDLALQRLDIDPGQSQLPRPELLVLAQVLRDQLRNQVRDPAQAAPGAVPPQRPGTLSTSNPPSVAIGAGITQRAQVRQVQQRLLALVNANPGDATAWDNMAQLADAAGQPVPAVRAQAEAAAARLDLAAALDRFKAGQDLVRRMAATAQPADHIEASIIDARLRQVDAALREQLREQAPKR